MPPFEIIATLIISGICVGFINTLAAGATIISMTVFMALGLPVIVASGTNRIAVVLQNLVSSLNFRRQRLLDMKIGMKLAVPTAIGFIAGAQFCMVIGEELFNILFGTAILGIGVMLLLKPDAWLRGKAVDASHPVIKPVHYLYLLLAGFYGGSIYVGVGYFLLAIAVMGLGYDLIKANAIKGFLALVCTPFSLIVFILYGQVNYTYGLIHAVGNIMGAYIASKYATSIGTKFIRWMLISVILISVLDTFEIINLNHWLNNFMAFLK